MTTRRNRRRWDVLASLLLAAMLFRAYVPVGFMPAAGTPFLLDLCPAAGAMAVPMPMPEGHQHHRHSQSHLHFENCPFGSVPASGPVSQLIVFQPPGRITTAFFIASEPLIQPAAQRLRAHQPRGPPSTV